MTDPRILATYHIETAHPLQKAAEIMAGEQSTGTFLRVPGETEELRERHGARIESLAEMDTVPAPSLPHSRPPTGEPPIHRQARVVLSFPLSNMGTSLTNLMSTVMGNLFELREFSGLKLMDLEFPEAFARAYPGPQFATPGTRRLTGIEGRPIIGTIVKPSVGLSPASTAALVDQLIQGGLDFIKDDELQADGPHNPLRRRIDAVMPIIEKHAQRTGRKAMYAFNITGEVDDMRRGHDVVLEAGGTCVMASINSVGLAGVSALRKHAQLPIHAHRNGWGMLTRNPMLGIDIMAYQKIWRLVGVDHMHCNGLANKFWEPGDSSMRAARACATPLFAPPGPAYTVTPVLSSAQWAGQAPETYARLETTDLMYVCGGGIIGHPDGVAAGVASVQQAWQAAQDGRTLEDHATSHPELARALSYFGTKA